MAGHSNHSAPSWVDHICERAGAHGLVVQIEGVPFGEFGAAREEGDLKVTLIRGKLSSPRLYTGAERHDPAALDRGLDTQIAALETLQRELEAGWQGKR